MDERIYNNVTLYSILEYATNASAGKTLEGKGMNFLQLRGLYSNGDDDKLNL